MERHIQRIILLLIIGLSGISTKAQNNMTDTKLEKLVTISAFTAKGELNKLKIELNKGLDEGWTVNEVKEMIVHTYAYNGFPRAIRGVQTLMAALDERKAKGINDNWGREASPITDNRDKYDRGKEILAELQGVTDLEGRSKSGYASFSQEIEKFLKEHLFADIFERDVLTYDQRELVTISVLIAIGGLEPMLRSHMNICLNSGITSEQMKQVFNVFDMQVSEENTENARPILEELIITKMGI